MAFTTVAFLFFFLPIAVGSYYLFSLLKNNNLNNFILVVFSLILYAASGFKTTIYLIIFILVLYFMGIVLNNIKDKNNKTRIFIFFIVIIVLILSYYKYAIFIFELFGKATNTFEVIVPLGLSFIMFEGISYLVDIYKKEVKKSSLLDTFLFFTFFPKVASGPIILWKDFSKQLNNREVSVDLFFSGLEKIMIGYAKKSIIADSLGVVVQNISTNSQNGIDTISAVGCALCYFLQIYYDFSGYSDIAIGISRLFGFKFKENFNYPYTSYSVGEFWRRWHISLGTWFRQYIYIPLGGNRKHVYINLFIVFLITGIWHGSTMNFVLWGVLHGFIVICERYVRDKEWYKKTPNIFKWLFTMMFVFVTWIIFMMPSFSQAIIFYKSMLGSPAGAIYFTYEYYFNSKTLVIIIIGVIGAFSGKIKIMEKFSNITSSKIGFILKELIIIFIFILAILFMVNSSYSPFLYFQF